MTTPFDLGDKVAIVTGSSRGIGRASAEAMARLGAKVVVSSHKADACEAVARGIRESGGEAAVVSCNISQSAMPVIGFPHLTISLVFTEALERSVYRRRKRSDRVPIGPRSKRSILAAGRGIGSSSGGCDCFT